MEQTFRCDLCHLETSLTERCRDQTIFESGWVICTRCESGLRQRLAMSIVRTLSQAGQHVNGRLAQQRVDPSLKMQEKQNLYQNEESWAFPHIAGSTYQSAKKYRARIDTYTASYMRWQNKAHVLAWLDSFDHKSALRPVFLDTETTGMQRLSEIIEVCIIDEQGQTLFHSLVNPTTEIEPMASAVHGLTHKHVKNAPRYPEIHEEVMEHLHNRVVIAYSVSFDIRLLKQTVDCYELTFPELHTGCLMYAYAKYREMYVEQRNGQRRCKTHQLEEAMRYESLDMPPLHRAERDAQCVHRLFHAMKAKGQLGTLL